MPPILYSRAEVVSALGGNSVRPAFQNGKLRLKVPSTHSNLGKALSGPPGGGADTLPPTLHSSSVKAVSPPLEEASVPPPPKLSDKDTLQTLSIMEQIEADIAEQAASAWVFSSEIRAAPAGTCSARKCKKTAKFHCGGCAPEQPSFYCSKSCQNRAWRAHIPRCRASKADGTPRLLKGATPTCTNWWLDGHEGYERSTVQCSNCTQSFCSRFCLRDRAHESVISAGRACGFWQPPPTGLSASGRGVDRAVVLSKRLMGLNPFNLLALEAAGDDSDSSDSKLLNSWGLGSPWGARWPQR